MSSEQTPHVPGPMNDPNNLDSHVGLRERAVENHITAKRERAKAWKQFVPRFTDQRLARELSQQIPSSRPAPDVRVPDDCRGAR